MASGLSLLAKGLGTLIFLTVDLLLLFINGIIGPPLMTFIMSGSYTTTFGINMIPVIQWAILFMCLAGAILCFVSAYIEVFAEVVYYGTG